MSNGHPWTSEHDKIMRDLAGRKTALAIARRTGHAEITVRKRLEAAGLRAFCGRPAWTRRDWLLHSAAGLDFQISD